MIKIPEGYEREQYQEFGTFEDGEKLLRDYCGDCIKLKKCKINHEMRCAMGDNYPYWNKAFIAITPKDFQSELENKIICTEKEHPQLQLNLK